jgi:hypothetical protein
MAGVIGISSKSTFSARVADVAAGGGVNARVTPVVGQRLVDERRAPA